MGFTYVVDGPALEVPGGGCCTGGGDACEGPCTGEAQGGAAEDCTQAPASYQHHTLPHQTFLGTTQVFERASQLPTIYNAQVQERAKQTIYQLHGED